MKDFLYGGLYLRFTGKKVKNLPKIKDIVCQFRLLLYNNKEYLCIRTGLHNGNRKAAAKTPFMFFRMKDQFQYRGRVLNIMRKRTKIILTVCLTLAVTGCGKKEILNKENPAVIKVWHYYNGAQQHAFDELVEEFNDTEGREKGVVVESRSQGTITDLNHNLLAAIRKDAGAGDVPDIFAAYADTAYEADQLGYVADLSPYFSEEELELFVDGYIEEGYLTSDSLKILPVAKSVELLMMNQTDWELFAKDTGVQKEELSTMEGVCRVAEQYYKWTDAKTDQPNDGKAFFGRDSMANYMIIGYRQLAGEIFARENGKMVLHFEKDVVKKLWDCYYIPYIKGYFVSKGRFRSDDIKTGDIICCIASSSSATYFPGDVILSDEKSYPIEMEVMTCPRFEDGEACAVQQGAGMVVAKSDKKKELASVTFLKWLTQDEQNIRFSIASGYVPVTKSANNMEKITKNIEIADNVKKTLEYSLEMVSQNTMYTTKPFKSGSEARNILADSIQNQADTDREIVEKRLAEGLTAEEATAEFCTGEYFETWYQEVQEQLEAIVAE